jgi:hypothetical protein
MRLTRQQQRLLFLDELVKALVDRGPLDGFGCHIHLAD